MEKDHSEAQVNKLVSWVTERGPQQLHASHNHQENVPDSVPLFPHLYPEEHPTAKLR